MSPRTWSLRAVAMLSAGALVVHELRYGHGSGHAPASQGHDYLAAVTPLVIALVVFALGAWLRRAGTGSGSAVDAATTMSFRRAWAGAAIVLAGVHLGQESVESLLTTGHPAGAFAHGGGVALGLSIAVGAVVALGLRGTDAAAEAARPVRRPSLALPRPLALLTVAGETLVVRRPPPRHKAGRAPPLLPA